MIILNYANCDMVGHTGVMDAAVKAVKAVDECVGKVVDALVETGRQVPSSPPTTATPTRWSTRGRQRPSRAHTTNPVPAIVIDPTCPKHELREGGRLCDLCPTMLKMMGMPQPKEMTGKSLF